MSTEDKPKIIVDDDWKTRVQTEKESLRSPPTNPAPESEQPASLATADTEERANNEKPEGFEERLPPASFESLVSMLVTQALAALGQIPLGDKQEPVVMLDHAKHYIDLLGMLEEKTKGNLSAGEANMLKNVLHELRMVYVAMQARA